MTRIEDLTARDLAALFALAGLLARDQKSDYTRGEIIESAFDYAEEFLAQKDALDKLERITK